jgi:pyruvate dehydrogenase E1 component beta subunit
MKYLEHVNAVLRSEVASNNHLTVFGQNVAAGSFITGFTKGLEVSGNSQIINSTNTENSLVGFGFGIMLGGGSAAFFMKQLDFLLLGIDQLVNTYNIIRNSKHAKGSFTILPVVVDMGY